MIEDLERLRASCGWAMVQERLAAMREDKVRDLLRDQPEARTGALRAEVRMLDELRGLPEKLIEEKRTHGEGKQ